MIENEKAVNERILSVLALEVQAQAKMLEMMIASQSAIIKQSQANQAIQSENCRKKGWLESLKALKSN